MILMIFNGTCIPFNKTTVGKQTLQKDRLSFYFLSLFRFVSVLKKQRNFFLIFRSCVTFTLLFLVLRKIRDSLDYYEHVECYFFLDAKFKNISFTSFNYSNRTYQLSLHAQKQHGLKAFKMSELVVNIPFIIIMGNGYEVRKTSKEQTNMPRFRLEGSRPCRIFCFALIHYT